MDRAELCVGRGRPHLPTQAYEAMKAPVKPCTVCDLSEDLSKVRAQVAVLTHYVGVSNDLDKRLLTASLMDVHERLRVLEERGALGATE